MSNRKNFALFPQLLLDTHSELLVDLFAGGGGASSGIEQATGRQVDIAINHDAAAVALHQANHPQTKHLVSDVFEVDPRVVCEGRPVGLLWASPDCTFHSKARGGKPIRDKTKKRRALAWVVTRWAGQVRPRVICLENVEEFADWGPLVGPPDALRPCKKRRGQTFRQWVRSLESLGYVCEWRELKACDYGAPTIRKRFFFIARCDGQPIVWPKPTHGVGLLPYRTAAECIDWSIPMLSIFATKDEAKAWGKERGQAAPIRPLADNTMRRIARGVKRYVLDNPKPYLVMLAHGEESPNGAKRWGSGVRSTDEPFSTVACSSDTGIVSPVIASVANSKTTGQGPNVWDAQEPLRTVTSTNPFGVVAPMVVPVTHSGERRTPSADEPLPTITTAQRGELGIVAPFVSRCDMTSAVERNGIGGIDEPVKTITTVNGQAVVAPYVVPRYGEREGQEPRARSVEDPLPTVVNDGNGGSLVAASLSTYHTEKGANEVRGGLLDDPIATLDTQNRHAVIAANVTKFSENSDGGVPSDPLDTVMAGAPRHGVVASFLGQHNGGFAEGNSGDGHPIDESMSTISTKGPHQSVVSAFLDQANGGFENRVGRDVDEPLSTVLANSRGHHGLFAANLIKEKGTSTAADVADPLHTVGASGTHDGVVATHIQRDFGQSVGSASDEPLGTVTGGSNGHAAMVASFLQKYYGTGGAQMPDVPAHTIPTIDRFGVVTVDIDGQTYVIQDIAMRMLQPKELYAAQGFRPGYIIDRGADGRILTKTEQVRMVGNSVCPQLAEALVFANVPEMVVRRAA